MLRLHQVNWVWTTRSLPFPHVPVMSLPVMWFREKRVDTLDVVKKSDSTKQTGDN